MDVEGQSARELVEELMDGRRIEHRLATLSRPRLQSGEPFEDVSLNPLLNRATRQADPLGDVLCRLSQSSLPRDPNPLGLPNLPLLSQQRLPFLR